VKGIDTAIVIYTTMKNRFVILAELWDKSTIPIYESPKDPFHCIMLATQQEIGLFVLPSLPRANNGKETNSSES
jgi:hypothetical protein